MAYIPIIILLILILAVIGAIFCGIHYIRKKTQEIFGTPDISKVAQKMQQEYSETPKSISAMTSLLLPQIVSDFPDFQYDEMKERAENILTDYLRAISERNPSLLRDGNTELKNHLDNQIQMLSARDLHEHFEQIKLHRTEITQYKKTKGRCVITFQSAVECYHYITQGGNSSAVKEGSKEYKYQTRYNIDLIYIQNRDLVENELDYALGVNCPNCGAPLSSLGAKVCEYCGTPVIEINIHAWSFSNIDEAR